MNKDAIDLIKKFEGCSLEAYLCPAKVWTIGYGHTSGVKKGDKITQAQALDYLIKDLDVFESGVIRLTSGLGLNNNQIGALISFAFNLGLGALGGSTLLKLLKQGKIKEASLEFAKWNKAGGVVLAGLTRRRAAETELFNKPIK